MRNPRDTVVLITGAASGIGRACAERLARRGHRVFGADVSEDPPVFDAPVTMLYFDVDDDASVAAGVERVVAEAGRLDVVVNNAGFGIAGALEDTSVEEAKRQMETNFFGVFRVCRQVLPVMREQGSGLIVNVSSIGGLIALPFQGLYSATKFAVEGLSEALRMEVRPYGIRVVLIEPADMQTAFTARRRLTESTGAGSAYAESFRRALEVIEDDERHGSDPRRVARLLEHIVASRSPRLRYTVGASTERLAALLKRVLPGSAFEPIIRSHYEVE